jgi:putative salt-induced outer membrane protein YdiY
MIGRAGAVLVLIAALDVSALAAQAAVLPIPPKPEPGAWKASVDFGFNFASGNSSFAVLSSALKITRGATETSEFEWAAGFEYGRNNGVVVEKRGFSSMKYDYLPKRRVSPFVFGAAEQDEARQIDLQAFGGAGLKLTVWQSEAGKASVSGAVVYNYETFTTPKLLTAPNERTTRWSARVKAARKFGTALELENTTFFQPVFESISDYNLSAASSVTSKATSHLALFVKHLYRRDSTPREDVNPVDQRITAGLRVNF